MAPAPPPPFATYLLPSLPFSLPFRGLQPSTTSTPSESPPSLSYSGRSSCSASPSSSPPAAYTIPYNPLVPKGLLSEALQKVPESSHAPKEARKEDGKQRLHRKQPNTLKCVTCATDIALASQIVSKGFTGRHGRAYLVSPPPSPPYRLLLPSSLFTSSPFSSKPQNIKITELVNTKLGRQVNRDLLTGAHVVADVSCTVCRTVLGWKYVDAKEIAQRYKIGKFILEMKRVVQTVGWEDGVGREEGMDGYGDEMGEGEKGLQEEGDDIVVFNEDDDDDCDDLFGGIWDPEVVAKRRGRRVGRKRTE